MVAVFQWLSLQTGIGDNILRLLASVILGYPIAYIYRHRFLGSIPGLSLEDATHVRNNYIVMTGVGLAVLYNGINIIHSLITIFITYCICLIVGGWANNRFLSAILVFLFNIGYLGFGYYVNSGDQCDLTWTMPQCVLCLRMIGFSMDYYDGSKKKLKNNTNNSESTSTSVEPKSPIKPASVNKSKTTISFAGDTSIIVLPRILHFFGYGYFFSAHLVGPQFSYALYSRFISGKTFEIEDNLDGSIPEGAPEAATKCFILGVAYLIFQQVLDHFFPSSALLRKTFKEYSLGYKLIAVWMTSKGVITKYLGIWILNEGACILSGISFNGYDSEGKAEWNGLTNIDVYTFETATSLDDIIASFNINTNFWIKQYVFKRLKFLNSKYLSQIGSLLFLALWHGFQSGYFMCFGLEFIDMAIEKDMKKKTSPYTVKYYQNQSPLRHLISLFCYIYTSSALFYALISFGLLKFSLYSEVYNSIYWIGHWLLGVFFILTLVLPRPPSIKKEVKVTKKQQ